MVDGTQDAGATCNGISVGMGYTMLEVGMGPIAGPATPQPNPCL